MLHPKDADAALVASIIALPIAESGNSPYSVFGLPDRYETPVNYGTNPDVADTDGDGLNDRQELDILTNPLVPDSDGDGLIDGAEVALGTNPLVPDSDGDGFLDGLEVNQFGTDPKNPISHP